MQLTAPATNRADTRTDTRANGLLTDTRNAATRERDADGMAVASFVLGLIGLLVLNVFLGPIAVVLASAALWRGTARRGRAYLGMALGVADLAALGVAMELSHTLSWSL